MQRKVLHGNCYGMCLGPIFLELLLLFLLLLLKGVMFLQSLMDTANVLVNLRSQTTLLGRHRA